MKKINQTAFALIAIFILFIFTGCSEDTIPEQQEKQSEDTPKEVEEIIEEESKTLTFDLTDDWTRFPNDYFSAMHGEYIEYDFGVPIQKISIKNGGPGTDEDARNENLRMLKYYLDEWKVEESSSGSIIVEDVNVYYFNYLDPSFDMWNSQIYFSKEGNMFQILMYGDKAEDQEKLLETVVSTLKLE